MYDWFKSRPESPEKLAQKAEFADAQKRMFIPVLIKEEQDIVWLKMVFEIAYNKKGRLGCVLANNWNSSFKAVQEINQDMSVSKKPPFNQLDSVVGNFHSPPL